MQGFVRLRAATGPSRRTAAQFRIENAHRSVDIVTLGRATPIAVEQSCARSSGLALAKISSEGVTAQQEIPQLSGLNDHSPDL